MKLRFPARDIPPRAAAVIVALALIATIVVGGEQTPVAHVASATYGSAGPVRDNAPPPASVTQEDLDPAKITRARKEAGAQDLFAVPAPPSPPAVQTARLAPPPSPAAPPLPFSYLGRLRKGDRLIVYVLRDQEMLLAEAGAVLDSQYRVERISDTAVEFLYLPLGSRQELTIPPAP